jgi:hypothetical protein
MDDPFPTLQPVQFTDHPFYGPKHSTTDELTIVLNKGFSMHAYCQTLFRKVYTIGLSEIPAFLDHQCSQAKNPVKWLNSLEKLIKINVDLFDTRALHHRHTKLISEIGLKRLTLQMNQPNPKKQAHKLNGYSEEKEYSFTQVKDHLATLETTEEKIAYLHDQIFDYRQNPPDFVSIKEKPFDKQCKLEIERLEKQEALQQQSRARKNMIGQGSKLPYNGNLKTLCDFYYKLMKKKAPNGKPILPWTITQATDHICNTFCEPDGSSLSPATVRTYLSPSKPESRPKAMDELEI